MYIKSEQVKFDYHIQNEMGEIEHTHRALDGVEMNIKKGSFVAVLGHNGSGKSTFAKHLNALLLPSEGTLYVNGMDTKDDSKLWDIRSSAGMVFQNPDNQIIATIVEEDVAFGPENLGVPSEKIQFYVDQALSTVEMKEYAKHSPNKLSGGQKQRIAIAGVLAMHPECIVFDEPTAMLDPSGRREVVDTIHYLNREEDITVILITHYMDEAVEADYIYVMEEGKVSFEGTPKEVFSRVDMMKQAGLDVPQTVELAFALREKGIDIDTDILNMEEMVERLWQLRLKD